MTSKWTRSEIKLRSKWHRSEVEVKWNLIKPPPFPQSSYPTLCSYQYIYTYIHIKGYALCRLPPLSGRWLCGGGYVVLAHLPCQVYWLLVVLSVLVALWIVWKQFGCWRLVFIAFSCTAVTLDKDIAILGVQNLSFGRPGTSILLPWGPFCQLGDTLGDHGSSRKDTWGSGTCSLVSWCWFTNNLDFWSGCGNFCCPEKLFGRPFASILPFRGLILAPLPWRP